MQQHDIAGASCDGRPSTESGYLRTCPTARTSAPTAGTLNVAGELLNLAGYAFIGAALCLGTYAYLLAIGSLGASEALAEYERAWGDWPFLCEEAIARGGRGSSGEGSVKRTAPALVRTSEAIARSHDGGF